MFDKKEWTKKYRQKNKEHMKEYMKEYRENNIEKIKEYNKQYRIENKERRNKKSKQWREDNPEKRKEYGEQWLKDNPEYSKQYYQKNKERMDKQHKQWKKDNPKNIKKTQKKYFKTDKGKATSQRGHYNRRAKELKCINTLTAQEWINILKEYKFKCAYCGKEFNLFDKPEKEHVIPISKGGNNVKENVVPSCRSCNSKKCDKILL